MVLQDSNEIPNATIKFQEQDVIGIIADTVQFTQMYEIQDGGR